MTIRIGTGMSMKENMDESWKNWVRENMSLGIPKETIFNTLKNRNFDLEDITNTMGWSPEEGLFIVQDESSKTKKSIPNIVYSKSEIQHERRFIYKAEKIEVKNDVLDIYKIDNFLSKRECERFVEIIKKNMRKSTISTSTKAKDYVDDTIRTSSTCDLIKSHGNVIEKVNERIDSYMGIHSLFGEGLQGQQYDETQEFKSHTDTFAPGSDEYEVYAKNLGQRTWTFMIYLNEPEEGGETTFTNVKTSEDNQLSIKPTLGRAVTWNNLYINGEINSYSLHQGCPVNKGEKTIITKWFRERRA